MALSLLTLIGSIGLFLYGMKLMSEGLQKIAGDRLRRVLAAMTKNRVTGMLTGVMVTALVQSSSATTVMVVSFVNAGLITLAESMAVIMGANVGTTATTWIIATLGFKFDIALFVFPLIALALPFFNSRHSRKNAWGEFIIGFALLFLGLEELKHSVPDLAQHPVVLDFLRDCSSYGFGSVALFVVVGMFLTMLVQASSAAFTIALLMCTSGWISFQMGCALVLGSNIGTCITPLLASLSANTMAKRAAMGHLIFNVIGTVWTLAVYYYFCRLIAIICIEIGLGDPETTEGVSMGLTMFHTVFNIINLCMMLPMTRWFVRAVSRFIPEKEDKDESFKLQYIDKGFISSSGEMALIQVQREASRYASETYKMFGMIRTMLVEPMGSERQLSLMQRVNRMEEESDRAELEIAQFLNSIAPNTLSITGELKCRNLYKVVDELESIADSICHCSASLYQKSEQRIRFSDEMNANLTRMMSYTDAALVHMLTVLELDDIPGNALNKAYNFEDEINNLRNQLRNEMLDSIDQRKVEYQQNTYFMLLINECEKIGDYIINVIAAASEK